MGGLTIPVALIRRACEKVWERGHLSWGGREVEGESDWVGCTQGRTLGPYMSTEDMCHVVFLEFHS
jgi:hypothetical protein